MSFPIVNGIHPGKSGHCGLISHFAPSIIRFDCAFCTLPGYLFPLNLETNITIPSFIRIKKNLRWRLSLQNLRTHKCKVALFRHLSRSRNYDNVIYTRSTIFSSHSSSIRFPSFFLAGFLSFLIGGDGISTFF